MGRTRSSLGRCQEGVKKKSSFNTVVLLSERVLGHRHIARRADRKIYSKALPRQPRELDHKLIVGISTYLNDRPGKHG